MKLRMIVEQDQGWFVTGYSLMPYLKRGGPFERVPAANDLSEFLEKLWVVNRGRPYFPTYVSSPSNQIWEMPPEAKRNLITQLKEFSGGPYNADDPSPYTSDEVEPLKSIYNKYMKHLRPDSSV